MLKILAIPGTDERLSLITSAYAGSEPYNGWLEDERGNVWARLDAFRFRFVKFEEVTDAERAIVEKNGPTNVVVPHSVYESAMGDRFEWSGRTIELEDYLKGFDSDSVNASVSFSSSARKIEIIFNAHGWSGVARVEVNNHHVADIDLFNQENSISYRYIIENKSQVNFNISVYPQGKNPKSQGRQILIDGFIEYFENMVVPTYSKMNARNRGGHFRNQFFDICNSLDDSAIILDIGGGRRQLADHRYLNIEYSNFDEPDIFGDATCLPFKTGSIDFIYTAAVLEHVRDPLTMGREIHRVLKPGCKVLANSAFMQPVHSEGQHFFNLTPYGIDLTFEMFNERKVWWETGFFSTMEWFVNVAHLRAHVEGSKVDHFLSLAEEFSKHITDERGM